MREKYERILCLSLSCLTGFDAHIHCVCIRRKQMSVWTELELRRLIDEVNAITSNEKWRYPDKFNCTIGRMLDDRFIVS